MGFPCSAAKVANQFRPLGSVSSFEKAGGSLLVVVHVETDQLDVVATRVIGFEVPCRWTGPVGFHSNLKFAPWTDRMAVTICCQ